MLEIIGVEAVEYSRSLYFVCKCDCGKTTHIRYDCILRRNQKSCGCIEEVPKYIDYDGKEKSSHNMKLYPVWKTMNQRCYNPKNKKYERYGKRGIIVCEEWKQSNPLGFYNFNLWALSNGYKIGLSLDRIDNNGNYEPKNCRWTDNKSQCRNKYNNFIVEYKGEKHCLKEWCEILNLPYHTIFHRIKRYNFTIQRAFETPIRSTRK